MPSAVEAQRIEIVNHGARPRSLRLVLTGVFGIAEPGTIAGDVVYANLVVESEIWYDGGRPAAVSVHHKPWDCQSEKRFALLLHRGETMDSFCASQSNRPERKMSSFFALGKAFTAEPGVPAVIDAFVGMTETEGQAEPVFDEQLRSLIRKYADPAALPETLSRVIAFSSRYSSYMRPETGDPMFDAYTGHNLPGDRLPGNPGYLRVHVLSARHGRGRADPGAAVQLDRQRLPDGLRLSQLHVPRQGAGGLL